MRVTNIRVEFKAVVPIGKFRNIQPCVEWEAELDVGEDPSQMTSKIYREIRKTLLREVAKSAERGVDRALALLDSVSFTDDQREILEKVMGVAAFIRAVDDTVADTNADSEKKEETASEFIKKMSELLGVEGEGGQDAH